MKGSKDSKEATYPHTHLKQFTNPMETDIISSQQSLTEIVDEPHLKFPLWDFETTQAPGDPVAHAFG